MLKAQSFRNVGKHSIALKRSFTTGHKKTQFTTLSNGITVATESNPNIKSATLGLWVGAGSTSENTYNNGVSSLLNKVVINSSKVEAAKAGLCFGALTDRDFSAYYTQGLKSSLPKALDLLNSKVALLELSEAEVLTSRESLLKEVELFEETQHATRVLEHVHATAFQNTSLALPTRGTVESLGDLVSYDLEKFHKKKFVSSNTVVVATGDVEHENIVELVEKSLNVKVGEIPEIKAPKFLGSEIRLRDDTLPMAWISIAHEGVKKSSPDYYTAQVASQIFGSYDYSEPISKNLGVKLANIVGEYHIVDSYNHFSLSYKDAGLWGVSAEISNVEQIDDFVHFTLKEWNRLTISITDTEVSRGKQLLKNKIFTQLSSSLAIANDIGANVIATGRRASADEIFSQIDKVSAKTIKEWAGRQLWDQDVAVSGAGQIEGLLDYARIRADTSMMRW